MQNLFVSFMRTMTPYGVGLVLTATGWLGIEVDSETAAGAVSLGLAAAYYAVFRGLEALAGRMAWQPLQTAAGVLLGWARPPAYERPVQLPLKFTVDPADVQRNMDKLRRALGTDGDDGGSRGTR